MSGHRTGASLPSRALRSPGRSASRASAANGLTAWVQSPSSPQVSGTMIQTTSQNVVGTMFSGISWLPVMPTMTRKARKSKEMVAQIAASRSHGRR